VVEQQLQPPQVHRVKLQAPNCPADQPAHFYPPPLVRLGTEMPREVCDEDAYEKIKIHITICR
jgi:hypothetical protein